MCNIIILKPGQMPIREEFDNMCYNNWHAFGLVVRIDGKLDITKQAFTPDNEMQPRVIWDLLKRDIQYERFLHVRHMTAGNNEVENAHPFDVYFSKKRHVVFMHNGTLYEYKSKKIVNGSSVDDDSGPSDTKNFVDDILSPYISAMDFGNGHGDISSPKAVKLFHKFWPFSSNRGLLIANDQDFRILGDWKKRKDENGEEYLSSNDDYFTRVTRGPEFARRESFRKAEEAKKAANDSSKTSSSTAIQITPLSKYPNLGKPRLSYFELTGNITKNLAQDWNIYDREGAVTLGALTQKELDELYKNETDCKIIMDLVLADYARLYEEHTDLQGRHERASKMIADLQGKKKKAA